MKYLFLLIFTISKAYAEPYSEINHIRDISQVTDKADKDTLVIFDVDYVISSPIDLIGRPKANKIKNMIFKEYEQQYGKARINAIHSLYWLKTTEDFVEQDIKEIILNLQKRKIPTIALTKVSREKYGYINDPMTLRTSRLKEKGIIFSFGKLNERIVFGDDSGYNSGILFAGKESKGMVLKYFLENIAHWQPKHIIFTDDRAEHLASVNDTCNDKAAVFNKDNDLSPEVARFQLKTLDEKQIWIPDSQAVKLVHNS
jgi:hypothetical protein